MENSVKLTNLGMPTQLALEVARQIAEGGSTEGLVRLGVPSTLAAEIARQIDTGGGDVLNPLRLVARGMPTQLAIEVARQIEEGGGGGIVPLSQPRIGMIGPSTVEYNHYGVSDGAGIRNGAAASGPYTWSAAEARMGNLYTEGSNSFPYFTGDNRGTGGAGLADYPAQIAALATRLSGVPAANRVVIYDPGRNDIQTGMTVADFKTAVLRDIADMRTRGFAMIFLSNLWKKPVAYGGVWASGGSARLAVDEINAWMLTLVAADLKIIDFTSTLTNFGNADQDPYANVVRSIDNTHLTNFGGRLAGKAVTAAMTPYISRMVYPAAPAENLIAPFSGTGGAKAGTGITGSVVDGWSMAYTGSSGAVACSTPTIDSKTWQRFIATATNALPASGANITLLKNDLLPIAQGARWGMRARVKIPATLVPYSVLLQLGATLNEGATPYERSGLITGVANLTAQTAVGGAGTNFQNAVKFDGSEDLDLWLESPSFVQGDVGGSNIGVSLTLTIAPGPNAGAAFQFDMGDLQTFTWPI